MCSAENPDTKVIATLAHTGSPGDGKIFVYLVGAVVNIRTNAWLPM